MARQVCRSFINYHRGWLGCLGALIAASPALAHHPKGSSDHKHPIAIQFVAAPAADAAAQATTGSGNLVFRYNAELSAIPKELAEKIGGAHSGIGKAPGGELFLGLNGVGVVRISADLKRKRFLPSDPDVVQGGLHDVTYAKRQGAECLVLCDSNDGKLHVIDLDGKLLQTIGRPEANDYYQGGGKFSPTDADATPDGTLFISDGYAGKYVLTADLNTGRYRPLTFGGPTGQEKQMGSRVEGKFVTNHGITWDEEAGELAVSDREGGSLQRHSTAGKFLGWVDMEEARPCDADFVTYRGERLIVSGCLRGPDDSPGLVKIVRDGKVVSTLRPKLDLGIQEVDYIHDAVAVVIDNKLYVVCYGYNPGCFVVLEHVE